MPWDEDMGMSSRPMRRNADRHGHGDWFDSVLLAARGRGFCRFLGAQGNGAALRAGPTGTTAQRPSLILAMSGGGVAWSQSLVHSPSTCTTLELPMSLDSSHSTSASSCQTTPTGCALCR